MEDVKQEDINVTHDQTYEELVDPQTAEDEALDASARLKAHDLFLRLQETFTAPAYITLEEVRDATGFDAQRTADAIAISLYRSRGKSLWGFEFKVSRNDWLKELKQPDKAESILRFCHRWALVVPDKDIVKQGELPLSWGLYVAQKKRLKCIVPPPILEPIPLDMTMFTAICYAINNRQTKMDSAALNATRSAAFEEGRKSAFANANHYEDMYRKLSENIDAYENASGLSIHHGWTRPDKIGNAVRLICDANKEVKEAIRQLEYAIRCTDDLRDSIRKQLDATKQCTGFTGASN